MAVVKNKTTQEGRDFWSHVEAIVNQEVTKGPHLLEARNGEKAWCSGNPSMCEFCAKGREASSPLAEYLKRKEESRLA